MGQGAPRPLYPLGRAIGPAPFLRRRRLLLHSSFRMLLGETVEQGPVRPPYPLQQGHRPCTQSAMQKAVFPNIFPHVAWGNGAGGSSSPVPPTAGPSALHPICDAEGCFSKHLSACCLGNGKRAHGRYENVEKSRSGKYTFLPVFSHFPRMQSIRSAVFHTASPWAGASGAANSQSFNHSLRKCVCVFLCSIGTMFARYILQYPVLGQGAMPLVGCRGEAPQVSSSTTGKLYERYSLLHPELGAGTMSLLGVEGAKPLHGLPNHSNVT